MDYKSDSDRIDELESKIAELISIQKNIVGMFPHLQKNNMELAKLVIMQRSDLILVARVISECVDFSNPRLKSTFVDLLAKMESCGEKTEAIIATVEKLVKPRQENHGE